MGIEPASVHTNEWTLVGYFKFTNLAALEHMEKSSSIDL